MADPWVVQLFAVEIGEGVPLPEWVAVASNRRLYAFPKTTGGWTNRHPWEDFKPHYTFTEITGPEKRDILRQCGGD